MPHASLCRSPPTLGASLNLLLDRAVLALAVVREGRVTCTSPKFDDIFGMAAGMTVGKPIGDLSAEADRARLALAVDAAASTASEPLDPAEPGRFTFTLCFEAQRADGSVFEAEVLAAAGELEDGPATVLLVSDITTRRREEKQLSYLAFLDPLTGLPNRALFLDRLHETLAAARDDGRAFAVMVCDLDGFKKVNDTLGHEAGDAVLRAVARRLEEAVRASDTVARHGGDEFAVILSRVARPEDVTLVAERMVRAFDAPILIGDASCPVGITIGVATFPDGGDDIDALIGRADAAMYEGKRAGKHRFVLAGPQARGAAPEHLPFFQWGEAHAVGVRMVDAQHRRLVHLMNRLGDELKAAHGRDAILAALWALVSFTRQHFATEEKLMDRPPGWPGAAAHAHAHKKLLEDLMSLTLNPEVKSMMLTVRFLEEWLVRHVEEMDKPMGAWLRDQGVA
jgi:diguanylate cyclase (GGDEF)-like protein/hemerythrin-like metal-binding protein/PAS domain S-box-containing protein